VTVPRDYDADPERFLSGTGWPHDDVHPYVAARFAAGGRERCSTSPAATWPARCPTCR
jgi:hypothetical protein